MRHGFIKVAAATPKIKVADTVYNTEQIRLLMTESAAWGARVTVFPELCITGYTCQDLFLQEKLIAGAKDALMQLAEASAAIPGIYFVGLPYEINGKLYNVAAAISDGQVLGMVPKSWIPNYNEFYEMRHFASGAELSTDVTLPDGSEVLVDREQLFVCEQMNKLKIGVELCEDLWTPNPPSIAHALAGADVIVNLSASNEITGKSAYRKELVCGQSARLVSAYIYASAGEGESTQDLVFSGHNLIAENGRLLAESKRFGYGVIYTEIDVEKLIAERRRMTTFATQDGYAETSFELEPEETKLTRYIDPAPFVPGAGGPVASFIAYNEAKRLVKKPEVPFGEGAVEGIVASESSNNACIGGALIPMLTLAVPGDAVTAIILSVFYVHGLQPGPLFITQNKESFYSIVVAGIIACFALLLLGLIVAPRICKVITIPKNIMIPVVTSLCVIGSFACNNRLFDVGLMFFFGLMGFMMRRFDYPVAPLILAMVLGKMMDSNFRQAVSLASSSDNPFMAMFGHPITIVLSICTLFVLLGNIPWTKPYIDKVKGIFSRKTA